MPQGLASLSRVLAVVVSLLLGNTAQAVDEQRGGFMDQIHVPRNLASEGDDPIVIAIVDDGFRTSHHDLKGLIWRNLREIPHNQIDDDGNGYVDDIHGWDVADGDNDVTPPGGRAEFFHGTHIAGIVAQIVRRAFGDAAPDRVRIMLVKSLSDRAATTDLKEAFRGIEYAIAAGADIILCSLGVNRISAEEMALLRKADELGILVVASAGNFPDEREQFPAAHRPVLAVAAVGPQGDRIENSNFGSFVDLSAPGIAIESASAFSDDGYESRDGTSFSAPMVAAAAALVQLRHPAYSPDQVAACLKGATRIIKEDHPGYHGKLGAGTLDVEAAVACRLLIQGTDAKRPLRHPRGYLRVIGTPKGPITWAIEPQGEYRSLLFRPVYNHEIAARGKLLFRGSGGELVASHTLDELPIRLSVPGSSAAVTFEPEDAATGFDWLIEYSVETIEFSKLYCSGEQELFVEDTLSDGSGPADYSFNSDCKWLIRAPEGKVIHFQFAEFDTEARTDWVYFFNGTGTHGKIMAAFSGPNIPPNLTTWGNQVLVWFVSNGENQGKGWKARYWFQDPGDDANPEQARRETSPVPRKSKLDNRIQR